MNGSAIAIIPARCGSKRVPRKNVKEMWRMPLSDSAIEAVLQGGIFKRVGVSESGYCEIAAAAWNTGVKVPFLREPDQADDIILVFAATEDMLPALTPRSEVFTCFSQPMGRCSSRGSTVVR
jgi:pseudaminic acid cytidylyltransferase